MSAQNGATALPPRLERSRPIYGDAALSRLRECHVLVVGVGGVGGIATELLARAGVGTITLMDGDVFSETNLNRQLLSTADTLGEGKAAAARRRLLAVAPDATVTALPVYFSKDTAATVDLSAYDYVIDAIDDVPAKVLLATRAAAASTPIILAMGAGNKRDPSRFRVTDLKKTAVCPLARAVRTALRKAGVTEGVKAVWSDEAPTVLAENAASLTEGTPHRAPASSPFCPNAAGLLLAHTVVEDLTRGI